MRNTGQVSGMLVQAATKLSIMSLDFYAINHSSFGSATFEFMSGFSVSKRGLVSFPTLLNHPPLNLRINTGETLSISCDYIVLTRSLRKVLTRPQRLYTFPARQVGKASTQYIDREILSFAEPGFRKRLLLIFDREGISRGPCDAHFTAQTGIDPTRCVACDNNYSLTLRYLTRTIR